MRNLRTNIPPAGHRPLELVFEIGCEELPATNLADIFESAGENALATKLKKSLEDARLGYTEAQVLATPRRLVFIVSGISDKQLAKDQLIKLIPKQESYDAAGQPTEKLLTILKHRGATVKDLIVQEVQGKETVFIKKAESVQSTEKVAPEIFKTLLKNLTFPKNMKWGEKWDDGAEVYFPRPIRHLACFYGAKSLSFKIGSMKVEPKTRIFSKGDRKSIPVKTSDVFFALLKKNKVLLDPPQRKKKIAELLESASKQFKGRLYDDPFLLNEVNFLVENPSVVSAPFDKEFLKLPLEVLTVSMARKQRIFGLVNDRGEVIPYFLGILDGDASAAEKKSISTNMENILHAKLQDSLFFYREDTKISLEKKRAELKDLVFLKGAGSILEKSERLTALAKKIDFGPALSAKEKDALARAAHLSKADLLTQMVGEFPELQGVMGKYYALANGEDSLVASAIGEQYLPRTAQDKLPSSLTGSILSALDKCDLIAACFGLGLEPSSSVDPYGLRRSATAVLKILVDRQLPVSLPQLLDEVKKELGPYVLKDKESQLSAKLNAFFKDRFKALLADRGFPEDLIEAVITSRFESPYEAANRVAALAKLRHKEEFTRSGKVVERLTNILKGNKEQLPGSVNPDLFAETLEKGVFERYEAFNSRVEEARKKADYALATSLYAEAFFDILNEFFEKVFVNAEDLSVRKNRLCLLKTVKELYTKEIADLSKIQLAQK